MFCFCHSLNFIKNGAFKSSYSFPFYFLFFFIIKIIPAAEIIIPNASNTTCISPVFGNTDVPVSCSSFTTISVVAVLSPTVAVIVAFPAFNAFTFPSSDTVITLSSLLVHTTVLSSVVSSGLYKTCKSFSSPTFKETFCSSISILPNGISFTVNSHVASTPSIVAVIVVVPSFKAVTTPSFTVATSSSLLVHVTSVSPVVFSGS